VLQLAKHCERALQSFERKDTEMRRRKRALLKSNPSCSSTREQVELGWTTPTTKSIVTSLNLHVPGRSRSGHPSKKVASCVLYVGGGCCLRVDVDVCVKKVI